VHGGATAFNHGNGALRPGEIIEVITGGSGGYGPPAERDPAAVGRDVEESVIDRTTARTVYGITA
jgi:N-methylhydantoinase B